MELSPQLLHDVEFREQRKGYDQNEVDDFLERLAAGIGEMQSRLREADERANAAERRASESGAEEMARTLVLAQRTADAAIAEARQEAARTIAEASEQAATLESSAHAKAAQRETECEARVQGELSALSGKRDMLQADIASLTVYLDEQRSLYRGELNRQMQWLDELGRIDVPPSPVLRSVEPGPSYEEAVSATAEDERADDEVVELDAVADEVSGDEADESAKLESAELESAEVEQAGEPTRAYDVESELELEMSERPDDDEAAPIERNVPVGRSVLSSAGVGRDTPVDLRATDRQRRRQLAEGGDRDPFLAELRRAVNDNEPLGPRWEDDDGDRDNRFDPTTLVASRFRRRRRR